MTYTPPSVRPIAWKDQGRTAIAMEVTLNDATEEDVRRAVRSIEPDADLIERMATALADSTGSTFAHLVEQDQEDFRRSARAALSVVRETEATR